MTGELSTWTLADHTEGDLTFPTYRKGTGPGVIVIHEIPGPTPKVIAFGQEVVDAGFTVVMPHLFGRAEEPMTGISVARTLANVCVRAEFNKLRAHSTAPIATWLRSLARELHGELGGPGVGALGMCFTGGFALAMMVDPSVAAPVLAQPSAPFAAGKKLAADVGLSPADLQVVKDRVAGGCQVLGLEYPADPMTGTKFRTLTRELGDGFLKVEFPGKGHGTLTEDRQQEGVDRVLAFFAEKLRPVS
ncbi:dienelactone hydrolase [Marmoricola sp. OAE513]|uniref:dienelactone hydrolase family protein n=1 Tax=Marmoricola sp. OAE513 TaxID=2817894 RepID=UPI001AE64626